LNEFSLILTPKAVKDLDAFSNRICIKIADSMNVLRENPFPRGKLIRKIKGTRSTFYRLRIDKYRVFYMIEAEKVVILRVLSKKDAEKFIRSLN
jgi:mRNA interferase RelE/StbE